MPSTRPSVDEILMEGAVNWARRSTCVRARVGAVVAIDGRVVSTGYNGAPKGMPHCNHDCNCHHYASEADPSEWEHTSYCAAGKPCTVAVHAETNAIAFAARHGVGLEGSTIFTTHSPCVPCAQLIINAGIIEVVYLNDYRITDGRELLGRAGVRVYGWANHSRTLEVSGLI